MPVQITAGVPPRQGWTMYPTRLGRDVYDHVSLTAQARSVVDDLASYVLGGARYRGVLPLDLRATGIALIVDGSLVIENPGLGHRFVPDCYVPDPDTVIQYLRDKHGVLHLQTPDGNMERAYTKRVRVWRRSGTAWQEELWEDWGDPEARARVAPDQGEPPLVQIDTAKLFVWPGGRGLLYWAQHPFNALEEIAATMRGCMSGVNLLPVFTGAVGSAEELRVAIATAVNAIIIPDGEVDRMISGAIINELVREAGERRSDFAWAMNTIVQDAPDRPVAADRQRRSAAMLEYVRSLRDTLVKIMDALGAKLEFRPFVVDTPADLLQKQDLIDRAQAAGHLDPGEHRELTRELLGLLGRNTNRDIDTGADSVVASR